MTQGARGLLLDVDGVLTVSWRALPGAVEALERLERAGVPFCLVTNATSKSRADLARTLRGAGFDVPEERMVTAPVAAAAYLRTHHPGAPCFVLGPRGARVDLEDVNIVEDDAEVVLIGGADEGFTYEDLNRAFGMLMEGAALVAMHRSLYWRTDRGLMLDSGAFLRALEEAAGTEAVVTGKPARAFFEAGLEVLGVGEDEAAMVGDDLVNDVLGAQEAGITGVLVRTGKFRPEDLDAADARPDAVVDSVREAVGLLLGGA